MIARSSLSQAQCACRKSQIRTKVVSLTPIPYHKHKRILTTISFYSRISLYVLKSQTLRSADPTTLVIIFCHNAVPTNIRCKIARNSLHPVWLLECGSMAPRFDCKLFLDGASEAFRPPLPRKGHTRRFYEPRMN